MVESIEHAVTVALGPMSIKEAATRHPIHDLIRRRWSPRAFADRPIPPAILSGMFEAARWAPSTGNGQPWRFIAATRDDVAEFARLLGVLNEKNQTWAREASALALAVTAVRRPEGKEHRLALYDLGLAVANLVVEGMAHGVFAHQMAGFDADAARRVFALPDDYTPAVAIALGYPGSPERLPDDLRARELAPRERKPLDELVFRGRFGRPSPLGADDPPTTADSLDGATNGRAPRQ
jgi:nitroreductase